MMRNENAASPDELSKQLLGVSITRRVLMHCRGLAWSLPLEACLIMCVGKSKAVSVCSGAHVYSGRHVVTRCLVTNGEKLGTIFSPPPPFPRLNVLLAPSEINPHSSVLICICLVLTASFLFIFFLDYGVLKCSESSFP